jgi:hypothetical protein
MTWLLVMIVAGGQMFFLGDFRENERNLCDTNAKMLAATRGGGQIKYTCIPSTPAR